MSMTNYGSVVAIWFVAWFILTVLLCIVSGGLKKWLYNRRIKKQRQTAYIAYIEKENLRLRKANEFYRLQAELGGGANVSL